MNSNQTDEEKVIHHLVSLTSKNTLPENHCSKCYEPLIFAMRDNDNEFSLGLTTVLECLQLAEAEFIMQFDLNVKIPCKLLNCIRSLKTPTNLTGSITLLR